MITVITEITKYLIILVTAMFTLSCYNAFKPLEKKEKTRLLNKQVIQIFVIHFLCYLVLFLKIGNKKILYFYGTQIVAILIYIVLYHRLYPQSSRLITNCMCFLLLIGYIILTRIDFSLAIKQCVIGTFTLLAVSVLPYIMMKIHTLRNYSLLYGIAGIFALSTVFIPGIGLSKYGAANWISIGRISMQPSEFVKILFVFFVASMLAKSIEFKQILITTGIAALHMGVLVLEKDLGGAVIFFVTYVMMLYVATRKPVYFFGCILGGMVVAGIGFLLFKDKLFQHVLVRVIAWKDPWTYIDKQGYQIAQSLFAIGSGGWFGVGLTEGSPMAIPVRESDFIFSVIAEELGGIFSLLLILIYFCVFIAIVNIAMRSKKMFYKNMALGFGICYIFQVLLNIGGVTKFIPSTGVTLPLISYGLSSVTSTLIIFQVIQGISIITNKEAERVEKEKLRITTTGENGATVKRVPTERKKKK